MEEILVKQRNYEVIDRLSSYLLKVKKDDKTYLVYDFSSNPEGFGDFKFAYKRLKNSGVTIPTVYELDKKTCRALVEDVEGDTLFDTLCKRDLLDEEMEQVFIANFKTRVNRIRLDFDPTNFIYKDGKLYYLPFNFTEYVRDADFTQKEIRLYFYTKEFKALLISKGLPIDQSRLKNEYERNKEIVLTVVKYFR